MRHRNDTLCNLSACVCDLFLGTHEFCAFNFILKIGCDRIPALVIWYLPVTDRLRRIFLNPKEATLMTWWDDECKVDDDKIAHLVDCSQWQRIDEKHK